MSRVLQLVTPPEWTDDVITRVRGMDGVVGVNVQRGASVEPPGDVVQVQATDLAAEQVLQLVPQLGLADRVSVVVSEPRSMIAPNHRRAVDTAANESTWDDVAAQLRKITNPRPNFFALMALSGAVAGIGLSTDALHLVIGAMVLAPGFEPLLRAPLAALVPGTGARMAVQGVLATAGGYLALGLGAAVALLALAAVSPPQPPLDARALVGYWSATTPSAVLVSLFAGAAGAHVVTIGRPVLTAGAMIALALVPSFAIVGMAVVSGDWSLALAAAGRWGTDVVLVTLAGIGVFTAKQVLSHRARALS